MKERVSIILNGGWDFLPLKIYKGKNLSEKAKWERIKVPSWWGDFYEFDYPKRWNDCSYAWYRKKVYIPEDWEGKIIKILFEAIAHYGEIYANGKFCGSHLGGHTPQEVDITDSVIYGKENEISVFVQDITKCIIGEVIQNPMFSVGGGGKAIALLGRDMCNKKGIWQDVYLNLYPKIYVDNAFVETSVREKNLEIRLEIRNEDSSDHKVTIRNLITRAGDKKVIKTLSPVEIRLKPNSVKEIRINEEWKDPQLWGPDNPVLYHLHTSLEEKGNIIDRKETRFGFREFWIEGAFFYLNGDRIRLRGDSFPLSDITLFYNSRRTLEPFLRALKGMNFNAIRIHGMPYPSVYQDVADEIGLLIIAESAICCGSGNFYQESYGDKVFIENVEREFREWITRDFNHPSIIMWSLANEIHYNAPDDFMCHLYDFVKKLDKSRVIYDASSDNYDIPNVEKLQKKLEVMSHHYPPGVTFSILDTQDFPVDCGWTKSGYKPLVAGEMDQGVIYPQWRLRPDFPNWEVALTPEEFEEFSRAYGPYFKDVVKAWRGYGLSGVLWFVTTFLFGLNIFDEIKRLKWEDITTPGPKPDKVVSKRYSDIRTGYKLIYKQPMGPRVNPGFLPHQPVIKPTYLYEVVKSVYSPLFLYIKNYEHCFLSNEEIKEEVVICNDLFPNQDIKLRLSWSLKETNSRGKIAVKGEKTVSLKPFEIRREEIKVKMPEVHRRKKFTFSALLLDFQKKKIISQDSIEIDILPKVFSERPVINNRKIALYDRSGKTENILKNIGIDYENIQRLDKFSGRYDLLVIGYHSADEDVSKHWDLLEEFLKEGGTILFFEQIPSANWPILIEEPLCLEKILNMEIKVAPGRIERALISNLNHPLISGIESEDLTWWRDGYLVAKEVYFKHDKFRSLAECGLKWAYSPLMESFPGKGKLILCQLLVTEKYGKDPIATKLFHNLLLYATSKKPVSPSLRLKFSPSLKKYIPDLSKVNKILFKDNFEKGLGNWTTHRTRQPLRITEAVAHSGKKCAVSEGSERIMEHFFPCPQIGVVEVWFYDDGGGNKCQIVNVTEGRQHFMLGISTYVSSDYYSYRIVEADFYYYLPHGYKPEAGDWRITSIPRKIGWHKCNHFFEGSRVKGYIDGTLIFSIDTFAKFDRIQIGNLYVPPGKGYFDDVCVWI